MSTSPNCQRIGGCLHDIGSDHCCCDDGTCDFQTDAPAHKSEDLLLRGGVHDHGLRGAKTLYRYEDHAQEGNRVTLFRLDLSVLSETEHFWTVWHHGVKRRVKKNATKRFACPTQREAVASLIARKTRQVKILGARLNHAARAKDAALTLLKDLPNEPD